MARQRVASDKVWQNGKKRCSKCHAYQSPEAYCLNKNMKDGLNPYCRDCAADGQLMTKYGITSKQFYKMLADQDGLCLICETDACPTGRRFVVDHDHACCPTQRTCGKCIRGLLCSPCNKAIGLLRDSPSVLRRAADYLEGNQ